MGQGKYAGNVGEEAEVVGAVNLIIDTYGQIVHAVSCGQNKISYLTIDDPDGQKDFTEMVQAIAKKLSLKAFSEVDEEAGKIVYYFIKEQNEPTARTR